MIMNPIVDIFGEVVSSVSSELTEDFKAIDSNITGVHYFHGHPKEIIETLAQRDKSHNFMFDKYPCVCLFQDFREEVENSYMITANLNVVICKSTQHDYKASERYEKNFKPFLYPIYESLLLNLNKHKNVIGYSERHVKIDRVYWGKMGLYGADKAIFSDRLDAIEIINLEINFNTLIC